MAHVVHMILLSLVRCIHVCQFVNAYKRVNNNDDHNRSCINRHRRMTEYVRISCNLKCGMIEQKYDVDEKEERNERYEKE